MSSTATAIDNHDHHDDKPTGFWRRWVTTTNHKDIGTLYLVFALAMFFIGGSFAMVIRAELFQPGLQFVDPMFFNSMTTMHALVMIFGAVMPAFAPPHWYVRGLKPLFDRVVAIDREPAQLEGRLVVIVAQARLQVERPGRRPGRRGPLPRERGTRCHCCLKAIASISTAMSIISRDSAVDRAGGSFGKCLP